MLNGAGVIGKVTLDGHGHRLGQRADPAARLGRREPTHAADEGRRAGEDDHDHDHDHRDLHDHHVVTAAPLAGRRGPSTTVSPLSERILIVEDEANIASFVTLYLQKAGYTVDRALNGPGRPRSRERASRPR